jgi:hypothetical protein
VVDGSQRSGGHSGSSSIKLIAWLQSGKQRAELIWTQDQSQTPVGWLSKLFVSDFLSNVDAFHFDLDVPV